MGTYYHMDLAYRLGTLVHQGLVNLLNLVWSNQVLALPSLGTLSKAKPIPSHGLDVTKYESSKAGASRRVTLTQ